MLIYIQFIRTIRYIIQFIIIIWYSIKMSIIILITLKRLNCFFIILYCCSILWNWKIKNIIILQLRVFWCNQPGNKNNSNKKIIIIMLTYPSYYRNKSYKCAYVLFHIKMIFYAFYFWANIIFIWPVLNIKYKHTNTETIDKHILKEPKIKHFS